MQKIAPFLWFDDNAEEAANFYVSLFGDSKILNVSRYGDAGPGPKGTVMTASFRLGDREFNALNGGPVFSFTPAISFFVSTGTLEQTDRLWKKLSAGGKVLMELDKYSFSDRFGWVQDKFGVSWQLSLAGGNPKIFPFLMFVGAHHGEAEKAINTYISVFSGAGGSNSRVIKLERYGKGEPGAAGTVKHALFSLNGQEFMAMDSNGDHAFTFNEAVSFAVSCESQAEVDLLWERLTDGGAEVQCGWLKDRFGVSWQIVPRVLIEMLGDKDREKSKRVTMAMLQMKKLDIKALKAAYDQK